MATSKVGVAKQAGEAAELLRLVEYLLDVAENRPDGEIALPLSGMRVALKQSRELMLDVADMLTEPKYDDRPEHISRANVSGTSLADRVQPVPGAVTARGRELLG